jgi:hypothetical protein
MCLLAGGVLFGHPSVAQSPAEPDPYTGQFPKTHGMYLDSQHRLHILEDQGEATIYLLKKNRAPGGPTFFIDESTGEPEFIVRFEERDALARIRAEVLFPAVPNYLKNPGQFYRITVEGLQVAPDYYNIIEVDAANALDAFQTEIHKLMAATFGAEKEALYYGGILAMQALNQSNYLPASVPLTVLRSNVGEIRIQGGGMTRVRQPRLDRFTEVAEGQSFGKYNPQLEQVPQIPLHDGRESQRGRPSHMVQQEHGIHPDRDEPRRHYIQPRDPREERMRPLRDPEPDRGKPGLPGKRLTEPVGDYPALTASQMKSMDFLLGNGKANLGAPAGGDSRAQQQGVRPVNEDPRMNRFGR